MSLHQERKQMRYKEIAVLLENPEREDMGRREVSNDRVDQASLGDTRKPHLTLKMLNHLKKARINKKKELQDKENLLSIMFSTPSDDEEDMS